MAANKISIKIDPSALFTKKLKVEFLKLERGEFNLIHESEFSTNVSRIFGSGDKENQREQREGDSQEWIQISHLVLDDFKFTMVNPLDPTYLTEDGSINFSNLRVKNICLDARDLRASNDSLSSNIKSLSFNESTGFSLHKLNGFLQLGGEGIFLEDVSIIDNHSSINASKLNLRFLNSTPFDNFVDDVSFEIDFTHSRLSFLTLAHFEPKLNNIKLLFDLDGKISGPISALKAKGLKVSSTTGLTFIEFDANISGLPNTDITTAFIDISNSNTTTKDLAAVIASIGNTKPSAQLQSLSPFVRYSFKGRIAGLLNDVVANGTLSSSLGELYIDALMRETPQHNGAMELNGVIRADNFDLGKFLNNTTLGKLTLGTKMSAQFREERDGGNKISIDSLNVQKIELNGYPYSNIYAAGSYEKRVFDGKVICRDPNLNLMFQGIITTAPTKGANSYYDFFAEIIYANLAALNFDKRDSLSVISLRSLANFEQNSNGEIEGAINIKDFNYKNSKGEFPIGDITLESSSLKENYTLNLRSSFADASYKGSQFITQFIESIQEVALESNLDVLFPRNNQDNAGKSAERYKISVEFNDTKGISEFLLPGFDIEKGSTLKATLNNDDKFDLELKSNSISYNGALAKNLILKVFGSEAGLSTTINSDLIHFLGLSLDNSKVNITAKENNIRVKSEYANSGELENRLDFLSDISFAKSSLDNSIITDITIYPSEIYLNGENWKFSRSKIVNQDSTYVFHGVDLHSGDQYLQIDGIVSSNPYDTLSVKLNNLQVLPLVSVLKIEELGIRGRLSGFVTASNLFNKPSIESNLSANNMEFNGHPFGELSIKGGWDQAKESFVANFINTKKGATTMTAIGSYTPAHNYLNIIADLNKFEACYFEPFLTDIVSNFKGGISGKLELKGESDKLDLIGENVLLNDLSFLVDFTNVRYTLNGPLIVNKEGVSLNNVAIKDRFGNSGRITGGLNYKHFRDLALNTSIQFNGIEALNTTEDFNQDFYGTAFGTGRVSITGPLDKILMDITVSTNKNTAIHIPLSTSTEVGGSNIINFTQPTEILAQQGKADREEQERKGGSELEVKLRANMTPDAAMLIEIDKTVGDVITGYGSGLITLDINPEKDLFSIQGDYIIQSGSYKFVLQGFIERDFIIEEGGNIGFNGDILKTNLNITANYKTKAAISNLIADTSAVSARRSVDCQIGLSGQLMNPKLSFNIDIPDIDPITKARVNAALNSEDKIVRQVVSLLVSGSFIPDIQSSIVNNSTLLYSNATEVLSNQINKIFNQLEIPLDLSFNYQPGQNGRDLFDAAVSAQLFNNRVVVNGNIGNTRSMESSKDVVGDLEVEIKLDEKGRFRAKAFSHSADQYSNYLDNSQRNGVGLVYQEEFGTFKELLKSLLINKRKRNRSKQQELYLAPPRKEMELVKELP